MVEAFVEKYAKPKNRRWTEARRIFRSEDLKPWKDRAISGIIKRDVIQLVDGVSARSPASAFLVFAHLRKLFGWCVDRLYLEVSPFQACEVLPLTGDS